MKPEITYHANGRVRIEDWRNETGDRHRLDGPAYKEWYENGQLAYEEWCINGTRHRLDGPAWQGWHESGRLGIEWWYVGGRGHRLDGPAHQKWNVNGRVLRKWWYINGVRYKTEAEFLVAVDLYKANEIAELF